MIGFTFFSSGFFLFGILSITEAYGSIGADKIIGNLSSGSLILVAENFLIRISVTLIFPKMASISI